MATEHIRPFGALPDRADTPVAANAWRRVATRGLPRLPVGTPALERVLTTLPVLRA